MATDSAAKINIPKFQFFNLLERKLTEYGLVPVEFKNALPTVEPNWYSGDLNNYPGNVSYPPRPEVTIYQQNELLYPVLNDIATEGLKYVYETYEPASKDKTPSKPQKVLIVGAGMAGLSAAYELKRAGHEVVILETQDRAGGRVKTFGEKHGFAKDLYVDAGAMRLPNKPNDHPKSHYLTEHYINKFGLTKKNFKNEDANTYVKFYNCKPMTMTQWKEKEDHYTSMLWPGWDKKLKKTPGLKEKYEIKGINDYYNVTMGVIKDLLTKQLDEVRHDDCTADVRNRKAAEIWEEWIYNWSRFPLVGFLRSNIEVIKATLQMDLPTSQQAAEGGDSTDVQNPYWDKISKDISPLKDLLEWPEEAIIAYTTVNYTEQLDQSLVQYLRDELAEWWSPAMHHIEGGMDQLPEKFLHNEKLPLEKDVTYNFTVTEIAYTGVSNHVVVKGYNTKSGRALPEVEGNAVIVTVPLHAIRQIKFTRTARDQQDSQFPRKFYKAVENIWYGPSTKIMIQSETKFWIKPNSADADEKDQEDSSIRGGFSKTNLPIGQLHYPTIDQSLSSEDLKKVADSPGILLCYMWKAEALLFGALHPDVAIKQAVEQIAEIHPEIKNQFQVGAIHAWYNDPGAQGAYALLKPNQYRAVRYLMVNPYENIFFAGEGISHCTGWIQGALESGLRAAYQLYARNERGWPRTIR